MSNNTTSKYPLATVNSTNFGPWIPLTVDSSRVDELERRLEEIESALKTHRGFWLYHYKEFLNDKLQRRMEE